MPDGQQQLVGNFRVAMNDTWSKSEVDDFGNVTTTINLHELLSKLSRKGQVSVRDTCTGHVAQLIDHKGEIMATSTFGRGHGRCSMTDALAQLASMID